jgi:acetyl-CoA acetyltransferase family protein
MKQLNNDPVIISFARTPLGKYGGILKELRPDDMLAQVFKQAALRANVDPKDINEYLAGCANQAGEDNRNVARMAQLLAGLPTHASAMTLNRLCASGLDAIIAGARRIITGESDVIMAGGVESMSRAPYVMLKASTAYKLGAPELCDTSLGWRFFNEAMREYTPPEHNGVTAERLATKFSITRSRQDKLALLSHQRSVHAQNAGFFNAEIIKLDNYELLSDEGPRAHTNIDQLSKLKPAFVENGSVTAGNSSTLNDGAAALVITSHHYAKAHGLKPLARIIGFQSAGVDPQIMGLGPVPATEKLLNNLKISIDDFSCIEINEAFAAQVIAVIEQLKIDESKVNTNGGAIALGHPLGCSGARIAMTLVNNLRTQNKNLGLATLCVGVGQGVSMAVEAL